MRKFIMALAAVSLVAPAATIAFPSEAQARVKHKKRYTPRVYTRNGRTYCRHSDGTTGLIAGGIGGALIGRSIDTRGDRTVGTLLGAAGGALAGRAIDRSITAEERCR